MKELGDFNFWRFLNDNWFWILFFGGGAIVGFFRGVKSIIITYIERKYPKKDDEIKNTNTEFE